MIAQARLGPGRIHHCMRTIGTTERAFEVMRKSNKMLNVVDRAMQCLGALGVSDDTPLAAIWRDGRGLHMAGGPDEIHRMVVARRELKRLA